MKISALITKIRLLNNDELAADLQKWAEADYLAWIADFFTVLWGERPAAFLAPSGAFYTMVDYETLTVDNQFEDSGADLLYQTPCIEHVLWKYFSDDSAGTRNDVLAKQHLEAYQLWFAPKK